MRVSCPSSEGEVGRPSNHADSKFPGIIPRPAVEGQGPGAPAAGGYGGLGEPADVRGSFNRYGAPQAGYAGTNGYGGGAPSASYGRDNRYGPPGGVPSSGGNPYANFSQT